MCKSSTQHALLQSLPKCEHHLHIEGSLSPTLLFELAASNSITLPSDDPVFESVAALEKRYENFSSLDDFLHYYYIGMSVLMTASDFEALAYAYFTRAHLDGVHHAEIFFDPQAHTDRGIPYETVVAGLSAAQARAKSDYSLTSSLILCFLRHLPVSSAHTTFDVANSFSHFSNGAIAGIGLDSSELPFPPEMFASVYALAKEAGINRTAHAGEEGDSTYVSRALTHLETTRIDHGIRLAEDSELLAHVAKEQILVTVCPLSNVRLQCVKAVSQLPIRKFLDAGVRFSINSDDPAYFGGYLLDNWCAVQEAFGLSVKECVWIAKGSVEGSWCGEARKAELLSKIDEWAEKNKDVAL